MKRIQPEEIDFNQNYQGYYWYSNRSEPELVDNEKISKEIFTQLPFIIEGNLYDEVTKTSINIKYLDGAYMIFKADLNNLKEDQISQHEYLAHDLEGIEKIKIIHFWEETPEEALLENMKTLVPAGQAFAGFIKN